MTGYNTLTEALYAATNLENKGVTFVNGENDEVFTSFKSLYDKALKVLYNLQSRGIKSGQELIFQVESNESFIYTFWACILGGIIPVPITVGNNEEHKLKLFRVWQILSNPWLVTSYKFFLYLKRFVEEENTGCSLDDIRNKTLFDEDILMESADGNIYAAEQGDIAFIQFSSGSTGNPKGVILTHGNLIANTLACGHGIKVSNEDSLLSWMPLTHDMGIIGFHLTPVVFGLNNILMPTSLFIRHPALWFKKVVKHKATVLSSPNFGYSYFLSGFDPKNASEWDLSHVRVIFNGAEPISYKLCNKFLDTMSTFGLKRTSMFTVYGMAEASLAVAFPPVGEEFVTVYVDRNYLGVGEQVQELEENDINAVGFVEEGYAVDFCQIRICDYSDNILGDRVVGQIQIKGSNVTSGYYNNPAATENVITHDGWLKTGDLGFLRDGRLVVTGRIKEIIFVNGQNIYPYDIERILEEHEEIETGKVVATSAFDSQTQREEIIIFVLYKKKEEDFLPLASRIKTLISEKTGLSVKEVIPIKKIPKTTSGKIQRYKLAEMYQKGEFSEIINVLRECSEQVAYTKEVVFVNNETEMSILKICREVFKTNDIGIDDNFFEFGANSLKLTLLASALHEEFDVEVPLIELFQFTTVKELSDYIIQQSGKNIYSSIEPLSADTRYPSGYYEASSAQKRLYVINQIDMGTIGNNIGYNMPEALLVEGELDVEKLNEAFETLIKRHEVLRTSFETLESKTVQRIHDNVPFKVVTFETAAEKVNEIMRNFVKPFELDKPPLIRAALASIGNNKHILMIDMHHIISDGWSLMILIKELVMLLEGLELPDFRIQYKDFAVWQNNQFKSDIMKKKEEYWLSRFATGDEDNIPVLNIPTDYPRPSNKTYEGDRLVLNTGRELIEDLNKVAFDNSTTLHIIMLAAFNVLLSKYSGQEDLVIGSPIAGRPHKDLQNVIGMFVNMLANRNSPRKDITFREFLAQVKENCLNAYQNQEYQFDELVGKLKTKRDMSRNPLFDYVFAVQNLDIPHLQDSRFKVSPYDFEYKISRFDMFLSVMEFGDKVRILLEYSTVLFKKATAERMVKHYMEILDQIKGNVDIRIGDIVLSHNLSAAKSDVLNADDGDFGF